MRYYEASGDARGLRFAVGVARFNHLVCVRLLEGCTDELSRRGAEPDAVDVAWVPGAYGAAARCFSSDTMRAWVSASSR